MHPIPDLTEGRQLDAHRENPPAINDENESYLANAAALAAVGQDVDERSTIGLEGYRVKNEAQGFVEGPQGFFEQPQENVAGPSKEPFERPEEVLKASVNSEVDPHQRCRKATADEPPSVQNPLVGTNTKICSSGISQHASETPPKRRNSFSTTDHELKAPDKQRRMHQTGDLSPVQEASPETITHSYSSRKSHNDSESSPARGKSPASVDTKVKNPNKPRSLHHRANQKILQDWYDQNKANLVLTPDVINELVQKTGSTEYAVRRWFRRHRDSSQGWAGFSTSQGLSRPIQNDDARATKEINLKPDIIESKPDGKKKITRAQSIDRLAQKEARRRERTRYPPERQGNMFFQCRYCYRGFRSDYQWSKHEDTCDASRLYVCMNVEPTRSDDAGNSKCFFCGGADSSDQHMNDHHQYRACLEKRERHQKFRSLEDIKQHLKNFHRATAKVPESWRVPKNRSLKFYWCGFCNAYMDNHKRESKHIGDHFRDVKQVFDMTRWKSEPGTERPEPQRSESQGPEPQGPEPQGPEPQNPEPHGPEPQDPEPHGPEPQGSEPQGSEPQGPESQGSEPEPTASMESGSLDDWDFDDWIDWTAGDLSSSNVN